MCNLFNTNKLTEFNTEKKVKNASKIQNKKAKLLEAISKIISKNPKLIENIWQDLTKDKKNAGSKGLSADQVFRIALLKNIEGLTYDQLVFHLEETMVYRTFCNIGFTDKIPSRSSLASLIKRNLLKFGKIFKHLL